MTYKPFTYKSGSNLLDNGGIKGNFCHYKKLLKLSSMFLSYFWGQLDSVLVA